MSREERAAERALRPGSAGLAVRPPASLMAAARAEMAERGIGDFARSAVAARAKVEPALAAEHFSSDWELALATIEDAEAQLTEMLAAQAVDSDDRVERLRRAARAYLDAAVEPSLGRVLFVAAPQAFGETHWRERLERHSGPLLEASLADAITSCRSALHPKDLPLLPTLLPTLARAVARAADPARARDSVEQTLTLWLTEVFARSEQAHPEVGLHRGQAWG